MALFVVNFQAEIKFEGNVTHITQQFKLKGLVLAKDVDGAKKVYSKQLENLTAAALWYNPSIFLGTNDAISRVELGSVEKIESGTSLSDVKQITGVGESYEVYDMAGFKSQLGGLFISVLDNV